MKEANKMKQTIIILMIFAAAVAKGLSANYDYKSVKSNPAQNEQVSPDRNQTTDSKTNNDFTLVSNQVLSNRADESAVAENNSKTEKFDLSNKEETELARSEMIASAMGIGIF